MNQVNAPAEILQIWIKNGKNKAELPVFRMILLGIAAGIYIGLGAHVFLFAVSAGGTPFESMAAKLIGAGLFPVGLMMVILCGAELFTGNNLLALALMDRKITASKMIRNWVVVYFANFAGALILSFCLAKSGLYADAVMEKAVSVAAAKAAAPAMQLFIRGILCNILVVLACWFQAGAKEMIGKIFAIWFPIMLFVFAGFEHSVANMTYIPLGMMLGADVSVAQLLAGNLLPVTLGNIVGGAVVVPLLYYWSYRPKEN